LRPRRAIAGDDDKDRDFVVALARGLEILRAFRKEGEVLGNKDFAARTGLSKSTISRLTYTLQKLGYLFYNADTARYQLAPSILSLGFACLAGIPLRQLAKSHMQELANESGMAVAIAGRDRMSMIYLERCRGENALALAIDIGSHIDLSRTAVGRAYIAGLCPNGRRSIMAEIERHEGENWPGIRDGIEAALACYRERGYCMSLDEWRPDFNAVAVPYIPPDGSPVLSINCGGPAKFLTRERIESQVGPRLIELVRKVSAGFD